MALGIQIVRHSETISYYCYFRLDEIHSYKSTNRTISDEKKDQHERTKLLFLFGCITTCRKHDDIDRNVVISSKLKFFGTVGGIMAALLEFKYFVCSIVCIVRCSNMFQFLLTWDKDALETRRNLFNNGRMKARPRCFYYSFELTEERELLLSTVI